MRLGDVIKNYLEEHDMSLRAFAKIAEITPTNLSYIINGKTPRGNAQSPTIATYQKIAKAMGITTDELVGMVDDKIAWGSKPTFSDEDYEIIALFHKASKRDQDLIRSILDEYREDTSLNRQSSKGA